MENGRSGLSRAFPGVAFIRLQNPVGNRPGFRATPAPYSVVGPGQSDALMQGLGGCS